MAIISVDAQPREGIPLVAVLDGAGLQATRPLNEQETGRHARDLPPAGNAHPERGIGNR